MPFSFPARINPSLLHNLRLLVKCKEPPLLRNRRAGPASSGCNGSELRFISRAERAVPKPGAVCQKWESHGQLEAKRILLRIEATCKREQGREAFQVSRFRVSVKLRLRHFSRCFGDFDCIRLCRNLKPET